MLKIIAAFSATLGAAAIIVGILITNPRSEVRELGKELGKVVGQVAFVSAVGGVLVQEYNRRRERAVALSEFRKNLLKTFVRAYADAKSCRRLLRAKCRVRKASIDSPATIELPRLTYEERLGALNDTQLELEIIIHDLNAFSGAFTKRNELRKLVGKMENYLNTLISEYEHALRESGDGECIQLDRLPRLSDFVHGRKDSLFRQNFTSCFHNALSMIQSERLL
jgi:hypothetical protein